MGTVVSFNNEKQKKQINLEKKLLRELSLEKMLNSAEECFAPLFSLFF
ncbi:YbaK family protein [Bacillus paralicheniformis]|nr:YbaK family protein [Bacillus paralicheniformis]